VKAPEENGRKKIRKLFQGNIKLKRLKARYLKITGKNPKSRED